MSGSGSTRGTIAPVRAGRTRIVGSGLVVFDQLELICEVLADEIGRSVCHTQEGPVGFGRGSFRIVQSAGTAREIGSATTHPTIAVAPGCATSIGSSNRESDGHGGRLFGLSDHTATNRARGC